MDKLYQRLTKTRNISTASKGHWLDNCLKNMKRQKRERQKWRNSTIKSSNLELNYQWFKSVRPKKGITMTKRWNNGGRNWANWEKLSAKKWVCRCTPRKYHAILSEDSSLKWISVVKNYRPMWTPSSNKTSVSKSRVRKYWTVTITPRSSTTTQEDGTSKKQTTSLSPKKCSTKA